jgi:hypothetical protein
MRIIYQNATNVRIWIPEYLDPSDQAILSLQELTIDTKFGDFPKDIRLWYPISPVLRNAYWSRVWVQQEIIHASSLYLHCGKVVIGTMLYSCFNTISIYGIKRTRGDNQWI